MTTDDKNVLVAINDIFFYSKLRDALLPGGYKLDRARSEAEAVQKAQASKPMALVVNMNDEKFDAFTLLHDVKAVDGLSSLPVLAFANHEEVDTFRKAKEQGVTRIVSRNEFSARTRDLLEDVLQRKEPFSAESDTSCH